MTMPYYRVYGKWYHLEYSDYFEKVLKAQSLKAALYRFAHYASGVKHIADIQWNRGKPKKVEVGKSTSEISFAVGADQICQVRSITEVEANTDRMSGVQRNW